MQLVRPVIARHPTTFGRSRREPDEEQFGAGLSGDVKLFATTFLAGFLFVSILLG
jgi:hypothetical protein